MNFPPRNLVFKYSLRSDSCAVWQSGSKERVYVLSLPKYASGKQAYTLNWLSWCDFKFWCSKNGTEKWICSYYVTESSYL